MAEWKRAEELVLDKAIREMRHVDTQVRAERYPSLPNSRNPENPEVKLTRERERMDTYSTLVERVFVCIQLLSRIYEQEDRVEVYRDVRDEVMRCHLSEEEAFQRTRCLRERVERDIHGIRRAFGWLEQLRGRVELGHLNEGDEEELQQTRNAFEVLSDLNDDRQILRCMWDIKAQERTQEKRLSGHEMPERVQAVQKNQNHLLTQSWKIRVIERAEDRVLLYKGSIEQSIETERVMLIRECRSSNRVYSGHPTFGSTSLATRQQRKRRLQGEALSR